MSSSGRVSTHHDIYPANQSVYASSPIQRRPFSCFQLWGLLRPLPLLYPTPGGLVRKASPLTLASPHTFHPYLSHVQHPTDIQRHTYTYAEQCLERIDHLRLPFYADHAPVWSIEWLCVQHVHDVCTFSGAQSPPEGARRRCRCRCYRGQFLFGGRVGDRQHG